MRRVLGFFLWICLLLLAAGGAAAHYWMTRPLPLREALEVRVRPGMGARDTVHALIAAGAGRQLQKEDVWLLRHGFFWLARLYGREWRIRAGTYGVTPGITPLGFLDLLKKGKALQVEVRLIEGWTFREWQRKVTAHPGLEHDAKDLTEQELMAEIGFPGVPPEGMFFPDTYYVDKYSGELALYRRAAREMRARLEREWQSRARGLPYRSPYEALIMASIVEKETGRAEERGLVAGVFVNRLAIGMRLQTDPAVIYGVGASFDGNLKKSHLLTDTDYNTYTRAGLPPTPIATPSLASMKAALHPEKTNALYFVAKGDGSSFFSETLQAHNQAVNQYQRRAPRAARTVERRIAADKKPRRRYKRS
ncbi:MAG: endolytic transglycosylase MltG [Zoogloeaceae bacterium]|jgi:UPF0755 protein|nr:endolytic transglycosylase MltG [Zoogloeaceae bacterium]